MPRGARDYPVPHHISKLGIGQGDFGEWLDRVTATHARRDRKRCHADVRPALYRQAIYDAVCDSGGRDYYTGERLDWRLLRHFAEPDGADRDDRSVPSLDHEGLSTNSPVFRVCSLRTNKCKSNDSAAELLEFCQAFVRYQKKRRA